MRSLGPRLLPLLALAGCELFAFADRDRIPGGGTGGAGGIECVKPIDCGADTECLARTCVAGRCGARFAAEGTATSSQVVGDCEKQVCDGAGSTKVTADDSDSVDDHNACTKDTCFAGVPRNVPLEASAPCGAGGAVCDGLGSCVACVVPAQCSGLLCADNHCVPATCVDQTKDGAETGIDCGGSACGPCDDGQLCLVAGDCKSGVCSGAPRRCHPASCSDGVENGTETDVDCGGACPTACGAGKGCNLDADCAGTRCSGSICLPSCSDGLMNGGETGVDCGGYACAACSLGGGCAIDADCADGLCALGVCAPTTCADGTKDGSETGTDCGGGACAPCAPGKGCASGADCQSHVCAGTICASSSCSDHTKNGAETGTDCGGPSCGKCPDGQECAAPVDCTSGICHGALCVAASCMDGVEDLTETDVDCGGGTCPGCGGGQHCHAGSDCASTVCTSGKCTTATCTDGLENGDETDVDCGGPCKACSLNQGCTVAADCQTLACKSGKCAPPSCNDMSKNGMETGVDCGGPVCPPCPGGQGCAVDADCASMACADGTCTATCTDGVKDGAETAPDCGGGTCPGCPGGAPCNAPADCASLLCTSGTCTTPSCTDMVQNGFESDVDCGGPDCEGCGLGLKCANNSDCASGRCVSMKCVELLLISELRTHGKDSDGFGDDFIELYNPGSAPVTMDPSWKVMHESAQGACQGPTLRFVGLGAVIPPHAHYLIGGWGYVQQPPPDAPMLNSTMLASIADAGSVYVVHNGQTIDALCFYYDAASQAFLTMCTMPYPCEGTPISNLPHNGSAQPSSSVDVSLERKPGGALGNGQNTGDNNIDFQHTAPANPQNLASPPTP